MLPGMESALRRLKPADLVRMAAHIERVGVQHAPSCWAPEHYPTVCGLKLSKASGEERRCPGASGMALDPGDIW